MEREIFENNNSGVEQVVSDLREYLKDAVFGDPKFLAFFHLIKKHQLSDENTKLFENSRRRSNSHSESLLRENEHRQALLDHEIGERKITLPGYHRAYSTIEDMHKDFLMRIGQEAAEKFPENYSASTSYTEEKSSKFMQEIIDSIWERY